MRPFPKVARLSAEAQAAAETWSTRLQDGRLRCDLCPRHCQLKDGQRGFCFVRQSNGNQVELTSYGRASGFCIDPIEKKPLNHFFPGSAVLSFGTAGCNLGCRFCQNWHISKAREHDQLTDVAEPEAVVHAARESSCRSIAFTYNDPVIFAEYAMDCAACAHENGLKSVAVTAGYITPKAREAFFRQIDAVNVDLKAFSEEFYKRQCYGALEPVLETLTWLAQETSIWLEVTTLLIEGLNTEPSELERMFSWYVEHLGPDVPLHLTAFHPDFKLTHVPRTSTRALLDARTAALRAGLRYVYTGNVYSPETQKSFCPQCNAVVVDRNGYLIRRLGVEVGEETQGHCLNCGTHIPGHFSQQLESFGNRRVRLPTLGRA